MNGGQSKYKPYKRSGFTLAEVLITLCIVGVVASVTIPALVANKAKQETVAKLQKVYAVLSQAEKLSEQDNGPNQNWDWGFGGTLTPRQSFDIYWAPYLKVMKYCEHSASECGYGTTQYYKRINGNDDTTIFRAEARTTLILSDGSVLIVSAASGSPLTAFNEIVVDINGSKGPNTYGKDIFFFIPDPAKGIIPFGYNLDINNNCKSGGIGTYCAAKIIQDGWQMKDDYPW